MSEEPDDPYSLVQAPPPEELPFVYEKSSEERPPRQQPEPEPSTSREEPRHEREHRASEGDGSETETSSRAVELVELEYRELNHAIVQTRGRRRGHTAALLVAALVELLRLMSHPPIRLWRNASKRNSNHLTENSLKRSIKVLEVVGHRNYRRLRPRNVRRSFHPTRRSRLLTEPLIMCQPQRRLRPLWHNVRERPRHR